MATLVRNNGQKIFVNDEETYKQYLEGIILRYRDLSQSRPLTPEEEENLKESMNLYNQLIDFLDTYESDLEEARNDVSKQM